MARKNIPTAAAGGREEVEGRVERELRKLPTTKAVDTKLVSRPRIHVETT